MEVSNTINPIAHSLNGGRISADKQQFEKMWQDSISGEKFEKKACEHLLKLYELREKQ